MSKLTPDQQRIKLVKRLSQAKDLAEELERFHIAPRLTMLYRRTRASLSSNISEISKI